jgi:hypothetical protein
LAADQERYMTKMKAEQQAGDDDEGDEAELSDTEDAGVQEIEGIEMRRLDCMERHAHMTDTATSKLDHLFLPSHCHQ